MARAALLVATIILCLCQALLFPLQALAADNAHVNVLLWFDTEDYILPASDDAALQVANLLTKEGIRGTFKIVGEKARTLERRGRTDVITALKKHEIGYHSNWHSVQPSPAMYLTHLGWDDGLAEFERRERPGFDDVKRIFGTAPTTYGQPGSSWAPQSYAAMKNWGMEVYLDSGRHVNLNDRPHFYCGLLNLYRLTHTIRADLNAPDKLKDAEARFLEARTQLLAEGGGVVSIVYHPCEFVHKQFWDGANFKYGANPPRSEWRLPAAKTAEETRSSFAIFSTYIAFMKRFPEVRFITASEAVTHYRDRARGHRFSNDDIKSLADSVNGEVTFQKHADLTLSASEVLTLFNEFVTAKAMGRDVSPVCLTTPYGPSNRPPAMTEPIVTTSNQFLRTAADVDDFLKKHGRVPSVVWLGSVPISPEAYLVALAHVASDLANGRSVSDKVTIKPASFAAGRYVADDGDQLWSWVIFPKGFRAPGLMELARRQAWTLKPAILEK
jgi:hypothetical protein